MSKEKRYFIYQTTNLVNNKKYIGYHYGYENDSYLGSGSNMLKAIEKYGRKNFKREILEFCENKEKAFEREIYWISYYNAVQDDNYYNISEGGDSQSGWHAYQEWRKRNPEKAKQNDKKSAERLKKWMLEHPEQMKKNGECLVAGAKRYWNAHPGERKELMKKVNQGKEKWQKEHPEEYQKKVDRWREAGSIANSQQVLCITTGEVFSSISEAARAYACYGCQQTNISKVLKGERHSCGKKDGKKLYWKRIEKQN